MPTLKKDEVEKELEDLTTQLDKEQVDSTVKTYEEKEEEKPVVEPVVEEKEETPVDSEPQESPPIETESTGAEEEPEDE